PHDPFYLQNSNLLTHYATHIDPPIHFLQHTPYLHQLNLKQLPLPLLLLHFSQTLKPNSHFILTPPHIQQSQPHNPPI
ncbi:cyclase family protein, partial [Staphylococcus saprophyticus]|uniref:cyclase family protein n=1 Tax=Staphylococcus saprophyticus TaxID=29385 RepID=UPI0011A26AF9